MVTDWQYILNLVMGSSEALVPKNTVRELTFHHADSCPGEGDPRTCGCQMYLQVDSVQYNLKIVRLSPPGGMVKGINLN